MSKLIGGLDEVGYGAYAGPIISVVAVFRECDMALFPPGVTDSKKMTDVQREGLYLTLCQSAYDVGVGHAWPWEIDKMGVHPALQMSYSRALKDLTRCSPDLLVVDGVHRVKSWKGEQITEPKADLKYKQVSAASVIGKVFRDRMMANLHKVSPMGERFSLAEANRFKAYNWAKNKGYGTPDHEDAIKELGLLITPNDLNRYMHRRSYTKKFL